MRTLKQFMTTKQITEGHDRREIRQCWRVQQPEYRAHLRRCQNWPQLTSLIKLLTIRQTAITITPV